MSNKKLEERKTIGSILEKHGVWTQQLEVSLLWYLIEDRKLTRDETLKELEEEVEARKNKHYCDEGCAYQCDVQIVEDNFANDIISLIRDKKGLDIGHGGH
jgi:flagellar motor component MotA